jgi:hypothetical protein
MNGAFVSATPRSARGAGPVDTPSPSRSCLSQRWSRHTPVHDPSMRTMPSAARPTLEAPSSSDPPNASAPSAPAYPPLASGWLLGASTE